MILSTLLAVSLNFQTDYLNTLWAQEIEKAKNLKQIAEYRAQEPIKTVYTKGTNVNLRNLEKRKEEVTKAIEEQGKLTDELKAQIEKAITLAEVEDIYRPYKQKKKTRATVAKAKGLEPLAQIIIEQTEKEQKNEVSIRYLIFIM